MPIDETLYANAVDIDGLVSKYAIQMTYDAETQAYWDKPGNFGVTRIGTTYPNGRRIAFASERREEVEAWTLGARAVMQSLERWAKRSR